MVCNLFTKTSSFTNNTTTLSYGIIEQEVVNVIVKLRTITSIHDCPLLTLNILTMIGIRSMFAFVLNIDHY